MLQINKSRLVTDKEPSAPSFKSPGFVSPAELYAATVGFFHRQFAAIVFVLVLFLAAAAVYLMTAAPRYTGHAVLIIDTHNTQLLQAQSQHPQADLPTDTATVDTQIEILKSENIAASVIKDLHLNDDPEFIAPSPGIIGYIVGILTFLATPPSFGPSTGGGPSAEFRRMRAAVGTFEDNLKVKRSGLTYTIDIEFKSLNPERAAQVANATADAYVVDTLDAKYQTTRRAASWMQDRLKELRQETANAEHAVVDYKTTNHIVDTGGRLMSEQQLGELNSALIQARAMTA